MINKANAPKGELREFLSILFKLSLPVILQNLIHSSVNLVDTLMVGQLGDVSIAGVGLGNQVFFILNLIMFGVASGVAVFIAQYWGKKDLTGIHKSVGLGLSILVPLMILATIICLSFPKSIIALFTNDIQVILEGAIYLQVVCLSYVAAAVSMVLSYSLRNTEEVRYPLVTTVIALSINVVLNYVLIFGIGFFPKLGVLGAGIATCIARYIEMGILIFIIYKKKLPITISLKDSFNFSKEFIRRFIKTSSFVLLNETFWGLGTAAFFAVYGRMGTEIVAAVNIGKTIENFVLVFFWGFAGAAAITIGKTIGTGDYAKAKRFAYRFIVVGLIAGAVLGLILFSISGAILSLFEVSASTIKIATLYITMFSFFLGMRGTSAIATVGVLRSGGDTKYAMLCDMIPLWAFCLPLAAIFGLWLDFPVWSIFLVVMIYDILRFIPGILRIRSGKWINNLVSDD